METLSHNGASDAPPLPNLGQRQNLVNTKYSTTLVLVTVKDAIVYVFVFVFFLLFLHRLIKIARKTIKKKHPTQKNDDFAHQNGYNYDFCFVFGVVDDTDKHELDEYKLKYSMKTIIDRLVHARLESQYFFSCQRDEIYVKIRADAARIAAEADRVDYKLMFDPERLRVRAQSGKLGVWNPIIITDELRISSIPPFQFIYGRYTQDPEYQALYKTFTLKNEVKQVFKGSDRIKLIQSIIEANMGVNPPGCGLNLKDLLVYGAVLAAFPLHDYDELKAIQKKWLKLWQHPSIQPNVAIKDYFGERIGLYFVFLQHYTTSLINPAILGALTFSVSVVYRDPEAFLIPYYTMYVMLWSTFFIEFWKQKQSTTAMEWGVVGFESEEDDRPQFDGKPTSSPVDGSEMLYFSPIEKEKRAWLSRIVVFLCILVDLVCVGSVFVLQYFLEQDPLHQYLTFPYFSMAPIISALLNALVSGVLNTIFFEVAIMLNDAENQRTDTDYEDALVVKLFMFAVFNNYSPLAYVAFVKDFLGFICTRNMCTIDTSITVATMFLTALLSRAIIEVVVRSYLQEKKEEEEEEGLEPGVVPSPIEKQYVLSEYDTLRGTLQDYNSLVSQYGYATLFVAAFPLAPTMAFVSAYIQMRIDAWKLCQAHQRPLPKAAEDMGVWQDCLEFQSFLAVTFNLALIYFTGSYLQDITYELRWIFFILTEHLMVVFKYGLAVVIDDVPEEVQMQIDRCDFLVSKVLDNQADLDEEGNFEPPASTTILLVDKTDKEWTFFDENAPEEEAAPVDEKEEE